MAKSELYISGIGISEEVLSTVVTLAVRKVEGVASVGGKDLATNLAQNLISVFSPNAGSTSQPIEVSAENDQLSISIHVAVFYGYSFTKLAADIRAAAACAITEQIGAGVAKIDVYIDSLVFPKE